VSVARGHEVLKMCLQTELCALRVSVETYVAPKSPLQFKGCQRFGHTQRYCGYTAQCVAYGETCHSGEWLTPKQQLKCCMCGEIRRGNKWLAKRVPILNAARRRPPIRPTTSKANREGPFGENESLELGWNPVVRGKRVVKANPPTDPKHTSGWSLKHDRE
jgi:hypothetical protein